MPACNLFTDYNKRYIANLDGKFDEPSELPKFLEALSGQVTPAMQKQLDVALPYLQKVEELRYQPAAKATLEKAESSGKAQAALYMMLTELQKDCGMAPPTTTLY